MLAIIGCGGHARSVFSDISSANEVSHFVDLNAKPGECIMGIPVVKHIPRDVDGIFIAIGDNKKREEFYYRHLHFFYPTVIAKSAVIQCDCNIKEGTFIGNFAYLGPQSTVGCQSIVNTGAILEHESTLGDFSHLAPHSTVCGRSHIGSNVFVGAGVTIIDGINICDNVIIGAGSTVLNDINESGVYCGTPAIKVKEWQGDI